MQKKDIKDQRTKNNMKLLKTNSKMAGVTAISQ